MKLYFKNQKHPITSYEELENSYLSDKNKRNS